MIIFSIWAVLTSVLFLFLAYKTHRFTKGVVQLKDLPVELDAEAWRKVSLVIPACNEAATIEAAARSLLKLNYPNLEIVIVNDRSSDSTGAIIDRLASEDERIKAIHVTELPDGWLGKVHALHQGIAVTAGRWIVVTDADVHYAPDSLKKAVAHAYREQLDFLTVIPDVTTRGFCLQVMMSQLYHQASLHFDPRRLNDADHPVCYGQGAFMLLRRNVYERSEGIQWLRMEAVDDTGLALTMRRAGARMGAIAGLGEIKLEWYPNLMSFIRGVEKNAFAFTQYNFAIMAAFVTIMWGIGFGILLAPFFSGVPWVLAFSCSSLLIYLFVVRRQLSSILSVGSDTVACFPLTFLLFPMVILRAAILAKWRGGIRWRGTFYSLADLKKNQRMKIANLSFAPPRIEQPQVNEVS